jgi:hypothetical protein
MKVQGVDSVRASATSFGDDDEPRRVAAVRRAL